MQRAVMAILIRATAGRLRAQSRLAVLLPYIISVPRLGFLLCRNLIAQTRPLAIGSLLEQLLQPLPRRLGTLRYEWELPQWSRTEGLR